MTTGPTVVVIGGGFSGSLFAMKFARARPGARVILVEKSRRVGRGLAYGACAPEHLLNVPVARVEVGLEPGFADWLRRRGTDLEEALAESGDPGAALPHANAIDDPVLRARALAAVADALKN